MIYLQKAFKGQNKYYSILLIFLFISTVIYFLVGKKDIKNNTVISSNTAKGGNSEVVNKEAAQAYQTYEQNRKDSSPIYLKQDVNYSGFDDLNQSKNIQEKNISNNNPYPSMDINISVPSEEKKISNNNSFEQKQNQPQMYLDSSQLAKNTNIKNFLGTKQNQNLGNTYIYKKPVEITKNNIQNTTLNSEKDNYSLQQITSEKTLNIKAGSSFRAELKNKLNSSYPELKPIIKINHPQLYRFTFIGEIKKIQNDGLGILITKAYDEKNNLYSVNAVAVANDSTPKFVDNLNSKLFSTFGWSFLAAITQGTSDVAKALANPETSSSTTYTPAGTVTPEGSTTPQTVYSQSQMQQTRYKLQNVFASGFIDSGNKTLQGVIANKLANNENEITVDPKQLVVVFY